LKGSRFDWVSGNAPACARPSSWPAHLQAIDELNEEVDDLLREPEAAAL
jgi:hypothetical protein